LLKAIEKLISKVKREGVLAAITAILRLPMVLWRRIAYQNLLSQPSAKQKFRELYRKNYWGSAESGSGVGSEIGYTEPLRSWLVSAIPKYNVRTFVDAPCGDFNWMRLVLEQVDVEYFGFDIVDEVIDENNQKYSSNKIHFGVADIREDELPGCDFLMVRDCLFHLSFDDIDRFFRNIFPLDYRYLLTTTHIVESSFRNTDIRTGDFRLINLFSLPFNFDIGSVIERIDDYPSGYSKPQEMILIAKAHVPGKLVRTDV